jgi:hypothetical protein
MTLIAIQPPSRSSFLAFTPKAKMAKAAEFLSLAINILWEDQSIIDPLQLRALRARCDMFVPFLPLSFESKVTEQLRNRLRLRQEYLEEKKNRSGVKGYKDVSGFLVQAEKVYQASRARGSLVNLRKCLNSLQ